MALKAVEEVSAEVPADDFQALEDKVYRTIEMYKASREARMAAEREVERLRARLAKLSSNSLSLSSSGITPGSSMSLTASLVDSHDSFRSLFSGHFLRRSFTRRR